MITKTQLLGLIDENKRFKYSFEFAWDETNLSRLYDKLDAQIQHGCLIDIVSAKPISYDLNEQTVVVEMELDCSDIFEEFPVEDEEEA